MAARKKADTGVIELRRLEERRLPILIEGVSPVIPHKWSEKAKRMMPGYVDIETGKAPDKMDKKGDRTPKQEAEACVYRLPNGKPGLPATAFKAAMVSACRFFEKPSMTEARLLLYVEGDGPDQLVEFEGTPTLREDTPRNANGGADLRYRYAFFPWKAKVSVRFVPSSISPESVLALLDAAGRVGVGDWRPGSPKSATGTFGTFRVIDQDTKATAAKKGRR